MSWLLKSFQSDGPDSSDSHHSSSPDHSPSTTPRGVKDDLSVLGQTLGRRFRGVAEFLAPPPSPQTTAISAADDSSDPSSSSQSHALIGIRNDLVEIGGSFRSGLSLLSSNKAMSEISRLASNLLQLEENEVKDDEASEENDEEDLIDDGVPGVTDEVLDFVSEISTRPELWTDFPLPLDNDFNMSDAQREHASTIERLAQNLASLRAKLQTCMTEQQFWMVYFILLLPRLSEHDFELLSTSKIVEVRDVLLQKLQKNAQMENDKTKTLDVSEDGSKLVSGKNMPSEEKVSTEIVSAVVEMNAEQNTEKWLEAEHIDTGTSVCAQKKLVQEEDISFSDLEDDDNDLSNRLSGLNSAEETKVSSPGGCNDWVQLKGSPESQVGGGQQKVGKSNSRDKDSEGEESNDWLTIDDFD
ncbi:hypothetical protein F2P56_023182 [Juglans regia]|uniref:BSD domain-containing protein n=2 Tax=Juglans regia TaxID=51240 RepID=A0A833URX1_JUGRE|nr:uncharacterized protein LOC108982178 [Juglans regia]KAF5459208.1 hypothetical protein F2P56_023182 [Juglans regia]